MSKALLVPLDNREQDLLRQTIGRRCRQARQELSLSQRALAKRMNRSPSWVREIEAGDQYAPAYFLRALATAAQVSVSWFYGEGSPLDPRRLAAKILKAVHDAALACPECPRAHQLLKAGEPHDRTS